MTDLVALLRRFAGRYHRALLLKAVVVTGLSLGVSGALAWRLQALRVHAVWVVGLPGALAALSTVGAAWWVRRRWISGQGAAAFLDRALGLQQRLMTAEEVARTRPSSALYPLLVEDAARRCAGTPAGLPRPMDRLTAALAVALLLLLVLPRAGVVTIVPQPAQQPAPLEPPNEPDRVSGSGSEEEGGRRGESQASATAQSQQPSGAQRGQSTTSSSSSAASLDPGEGERPRADRDATMPQRGEGDPEISSAAQGGGSQQPARTGDGALPRGAEPPRREESRADGASSREPPQSSGDRLSGPDSAHQGAERAQSVADREPSSPQEDPDGRPTSQQKGRSSSGEHASQSGEDKEQGTRDGRFEAAGATPTGGQQEPGTTTSGSSGGQQALKADIQELLKEMSGELKALQAQLAAQQPAPQPGQGADPELYEAPSALGDALAGTVPIPLRTDTAQTKASRPGGGTGRASTEVSDASPQMTPQEAVLSEQPLEESPVARQPIPPEYRGVFGQLHHQPSPSNEAAP